jgi:hypothetical protein
VARRVQSALGAPARARLLTARVASVLVVAALAWSAYRGVPHTWQYMREQHARFAGYTRDNRDRAYGELIPIRMDIVDFWRAHLLRGDRYWIQIPYEPFSSDFDKGYVVRLVTRSYLLPAIQVSKLSDANVVLSWDADPGLLHQRYSEQYRAGLQLVFVSRIDRGA